MSITLANLGHLGRTPMGVWAIALANTNDKEMKALGTVWQKVQGL